MLLSVWSGVYAATKSFQTFDTVHFTVIVPIIQPWLLPQDILTLQSGVSKRYQPADNIAARVSSDKEKMKRFADKVALVTGSGRGIGREIAIRMAHEGANLVINFFRNREPAEETAEIIRRMGRRAIVVKANIGDLDHLNNLFKAAENEFGALDMYIHNAASGYNRPALEQKPRGWDWTMNINARSLLFAAQHAVRMMDGHGGSIIAITSLGSIRVINNYIVVGASKAAIEALVRYLGVELAPLGVRVNAVSPGVTDTEALLRFPEFAERGQTLLDEIEEKTPVGRLCKPEDVAEFVCFLCTPAAEMLCGQTILLDGGYSLITDL